VLFELSKYWVIFRTLLGVYDLIDQPEHE